MSCAVNVDGVYAAQETVCIRSSIRSTDDLDELVLGEARKE